MLTNMSTVTRQYLWAQKNSSKTQQDGGHPASKPALFLFDSLPYSCLYLMGIQVGQLLQKEKNKRDEDFRFWFVWGFFLSLLAVPCQNFARLGSVQAPL